MKTQEIINRLQKIEGLLADNKFIIDKACEKLAELQNKINMREKI